MKIHEIKHIKRVKFIGSYISIKLIEICKKKKIGAKLEG
jgi:hypothetical protein